MSELLDCPSCKSGAEIDFSSDGFEHLTQVVCTDCRMQGPSFEYDPNVAGSPNDARLAAEKSWNAISRAGWVSADQPAIDMYMETMVIYMDAESDNNKAVAHWSSDGWRVTHRYGSVKLDGVRLYLGNIPEVE